MASTSTEPRSYVDFEPRTEWLNGKESDTIMIDVSGFRKEQLKVLINTAGSLKISGERPIEGRHWSRFLRSFTIPKNRNLKEIQAKFDGDEGLLFVILPISALTHEINTPLPSKAQDSAAGSGTCNETAPPMALTKSLKANEKNEKIASMEEEGKGMISAAETIHAGYNYKQENTVHSGRKYTDAASVLLNKRKLLILGVIFGVAFSVGLAVYLLYRLRGL